MAGTDSIEIVLFHQRKIFFDLWNANGKSGFRIGIMAVYAPKLYFFPIKIKNPAANINGSECNIIYNGFITGL